MIPLKHPFLLEQFLRKEKKIAWVCRLRLSSVELSQLALLTMGTRQGLRKKVEELRIAACSGTLGH